GFLDGRHLLEEPVGLLRRAEAHDSLDTRPVVPTAVEDDDLAGCREVRQIPLDVHLRLLPLGGGGHGYDPEGPWADPLGDPFDAAALASRIAALDHDADLGSRRLDPFLDGYQLAVQESHLLLVFLSLHLRGRAGAGVRWRVSRPGLGVPLGLLLFVL